jgi:hypothetical protein
LAALFVADPVQAERWKEIATKPGTTYRIDLDSIQWQGRTVRYHVEIVAGPQGKNHGVVTALIDCDSGKRKLLATGRYLPDGTLKEQTTPDYPWEPTTPWVLSEAARRFLCLNEQ